MEGHRSGGSAAVLTSVVVVCAERYQASEFRRLLPDEKYDRRWFHRGEDLLSNPDLPERFVLIVDELLSDMRGVELVRAVRERGCRNPVLMTVKKISIPEAVEAIRFGADNILTTPLNTLKLDQAILSALSDPGPLRNIMGARN